MLNLVHFGVGDMRKNVTVNFRASNRNSLKKCGKELSFLTSKKHKKFPQLGTEIPTLIF